MKIVPIFFLIAKNIVFFITSSKTIVTASAIVTQGQWDIPALINKPLRKIKKPNSKYD